MAVLSVTKKMGDSATQDDGGKVLKENYLVLGSATDTPLICWGAVDPNTSLTVPYYGQIHPDDATLKVASLDASRVGDEKSPLFNFAVEWRSNVRNEQPNNTKWNKRISSSGLEIVERVNKDVDGNPIRNAVNDLFQADLEVLKYDAVITVAYNTKQLTGLSDLDDSRGRVNDAPVTLNITRYGRTYTRTFKEKTLKLGNAIWDVDVGPDGDGFFNVSIPLIYRHQIDARGNEIGWKIQTPNRGFRYKPTTTGGDAKQQLVTSQFGMVDLAKNGTKLEPGELQNLIVVDAIETADFSAFLSGL